MLELPGGGDRDQGRIMISGGQPVSESPVCTGDPWIDSYLRFRRAWLDGATEGELTDLATECRRGLPESDTPQHRPQCSSTAT